MAERWVVDASPLIALGTIGRLDLLGSLAGDVVVPEIVAQEVLRVEDEASRALAEGPLRTIAAQGTDPKVRTQLTHREPRCSEAPGTWMPHGAWISLLLFSYRGEPSRDSEWRRSEWVS